MQPFALTRSTGPRRRLGAGAALAVALAAVAWSPQPAAAYETFTGSNCSALTWTSPPRVVVHVGNLPGGADYLDDNLKMLAAVSEIADEFNRVGATTAEITSTTTSTEPFTQGDWFNDPVPTIHLGFHDDPNGGLGSGGPGPYANCRYDEAHIGLKNLDLASWNFGVPEDGGQAYYDTTQNDASGARYFRLVYLHELLHTFGLNHSDTSYAIMNYGHRPWFDEDTIRPLPDDVKALRELYPEPLVGTSEVAVFNSWWTIDGASNGAAQQERYCKPSLGVTFGLSPFWEYCGMMGPDSGSTQVCSGSTLHTRFTLANYSTDEADLTARLWLSRDDQWDPSDLLSPTRHSYTLGATDSDPAATTWEMPTLAREGEYRPIVRVRGTTASGRSVESWTPQRGQVEYDRGNCLTATPGAPIDLEGPSLP